MQAALQDIRVLVIEELGEEVFVLENELAGEKHDFWKIFNNALDQFRDFFDHIGAKSGIGGSSHAMRVAIIDIMPERLFEIATHIMPVFFLTKIS